MFSSAPLDQKDSADLEEKIQKYKCPITGQFFLEPVSTSGCLHTFEKTAIDKWQEDHNECPLCRAPFNEKNQLYPASLLLVEALEELLEAHPEFYDERYFDIDFFGATLEKGDSPRLRNMIKALRHSSQLLNEPSHEEKIQGVTPLHLMVVMKTGMQILLNDAELRKNITTLNLNSTIQRGAERSKSIAYLLASSEAGREILLKDSSLCRKISYENLNKIITEGKDRGRSILHFLASTETGRKILTENLYLIGHAVDRTLEMNIIEGSERSALEWLKNTDTGRQVLNQRMQLAKQGKYIIDRGLLQLNPIHSKEAFSESIAIVSSVKDTFEAKTTFENFLGFPMQLSEATQSSLDIVQDPRFTDEFKTSVAAGDIVDGVTAAFADYQIPLGFINKMLELSEYQIHIVISDDDSMRNQWNTIENRMHQLINLLTYMNAKEIHIEFLNRKDQIVLRHEGQSFKEYKEDAHKKITKAFEKKPVGEVPLFAKMKSMNSTADTAHYFYLNAGPTDLPSNKTLGMLLENRKSPYEQPMTWIDCNDEVSDWGKEIHGYYNKVIHHFDIMKKQVIKNQGSSFPYNKGIWLVSQLIAVINPDLNFSAGPPFNQKTLDNLMGRKLTKEEYRYYFNNHPLGRRKEYQDQFVRFALKENQFTLEDKKREPIGKNIRSP